MKTYLIGLSLALAATASAQELKTEKKTLSRNLDEVFEVQRGEHIKDGPYQVLDLQKNVLVKGLYKDGKKNGTWTYYDPQGQMIQQYDFSSGKMVFNTVDSGTIVHSEYQLEAISDERDTVTPPVKIGGVNYGFYLLYDPRDLPQDAKGVTTSEMMTYVFTISETGQLEGWNIMYGGKAVKDITRPKSIKGLPTDAYEFVPATLNGKPVKSKITYWVALNVNHSELQGTNNIITQHPEGN